MAICKYHTCEKVQYLKKNHMKLILVIFVEYVVLKTM